MLMPWVLASLPASVIRQLKQPIPSPCLNQDRRIFKRLRADLGLNPTEPFNQLIGPTVRDCRKPTSAYQILSAGFVDDPDHGMDQNLPDSQDPRHERAWMGGSRGPTSQGFRHMYFGGWELSHPIESIQIPVHAVGQAPVRAQMIADAAQALLKEGQTAWAWRSLAWSLHYVQDLAQPFHAVQVLSLRMLPWNDLFDHFVAESTRTIANYHWAFEGLTLTELRMGSTSPLDACLRNASGEATFNPDQPRVDTLALAVAHASVGLGGRLGKAMIGLFGTRLKAPGIELAENRGTPDYARIASTPSKARKKLDAVTCHALANAIVASREMIESFSGSAAGSARHEASHR